MIGCGLYFSRSGPAATGSIGDFIEPAVGSMDALTSGRESGARR